MEAVRYTHAGSAYIQLNKRHQSGEHIQFVEQNVVDWTLANDFHDVN